jgi:hypothetical protein
MIFILLALFIPSVSAEKYVLTTKECYDMAVGIKKCNEEIASAKEKRESFMKASADVPSDERLDLEMKVLQLGQACQDQFAVYKQQCDKSKLTDVTNP